MAEVQLSTLGATIKEAYEAQPDTNAFTDAEKTKLENLTPGGGGGAVDSVNGKTGDVVLTPSDIGLGNVANTADADKPVSNATQTALNAKAPIANPTFTGTVSGITKAMVGLANVDNTTDVNKPVSTAQATAIAAKVGSVITGITGASVISNVVSLSQAAYDALGTKNASTLYVIV